MSRKWEQSQKSFVGQRRIDEEFTSQMLKKAELAKHLQVYKVRIVLQGENAKDREGYRAVFAGQGASAFPVAAAKFMDTLSKLPGLAGESSDTQVKMTEDSQIVTNAERRMS